MVFIFLNIKIPFEYRLFNIFKQRSTLDLVLKKFKGFGYKIIFSAQFQHLVKSYFNFFIILPIIKK